MNYVCYIRVYIRDGVYEDYTYVPPGTYGEIGFNNGVLTVTGFCKTGYVTESAYAPGQWLKVESRYMRIE